MAFLVGIGLFTADVAGAAVTANRLAGNKIALNGHNLNGLAANKLAGNKLASNKLSANMLVAGDLLSTADGRELLKYVVSCALPAATTLTADGGGTTYEFAGSIGLAPRWRHRRLTVTERRWVSACLLARVNAHGLSIEISLRGNHRALAATSDEAAAFTLEEGAFYGDVFTPAGGVDAAYACRGRDQAAGETGTLADRDCAEAGDDPGRTQCGFVSTGDCTNLSGQPWACEAERDGTYRRCHDRSGLGSWPDGKAIREVITVYVR